MGFKFWHDFTFFNLTSGEKTEKIQRDTERNGALESIPRVEGAFDFVFIDAHKPDYKKYYDLIRNRMQTGGAITAHNVSGRDWSMADFVEAIQNDPGLETVIHSANTMSVSIVKP